MSIDSKIAHVIICATKLYFLIITLTDVILYEITSHINVTNEIAACINFMTYKKHTIYLVC